MVLSNLMEKNKDSRLILRLDQKKDRRIILRFDKSWRQKPMKIKKAGGQTNRNWLVCGNGRKFFVRLPWERTDIVNRRIEAKNILALAKCKKLAEFLPHYLVYVFLGRNILNPKEVFSLPDGAFLTEYIEGRDIDGRDLQKPALQKSLLKTLAAFHKSGVKFSNRYDVFRDEILKYKTKAKKYRLGFLISKEKIKKIEAIEKEAKKALSEAGGISTHNDLIFENLRLGRNGKVFLLDFEYGGFNTRSGLEYDLGILLGGNLFQKHPINTATFEEILARAENIYKKRLDSRKIYWGALTNVLVMFWWGQVKYCSSRRSEDKRYFKKYVTDRARGIELLYGQIAENGAKKIG